MHSHRVSLHQLSLLPVEQRMPVTIAEKVLIWLNSFLGAIGTTVGIIVGGIWFASTPIQSVGLGLGLGSVAMATTALVISGVVSFVVALPIAIVAYRELVGEADTLNRKILTAAVNRKKNHQKIFFELLHLRALKNSEDEFNAEAIQLLKDKIEISNQQKILILVKDIYKKVKHNNFSLNDIKLTGDEFLRGGNEIYLTENQDKLMQTIFFHDKLLQENIEGCFTSIPEPPITDRSKAVFYGCSAALAIAGSALGVGWAFSALVAAAGLAAVIPFAGWVVLGVAAITIGVMFGLGMGLYKQKNIQRDELCKRVVDRNNICKTLVNSLRKRVVELMPSNKNLIKELDVIKRNSAAHVVLVTAQADAKVHQAEKIAAGFKRENARLIVDNSIILQRNKELESLLQAAQLKLELTSVNHASTQKALTIFQSHSASPAASVMAP